MSIILLLLIITIFSNARFVEDGTIHSNYLDKKQTTTINGIFVFLVFLSHGKQYMNLSGPYHETYLSLATFLHQAVVVTFLFYSGFGVMESIKKKGHQYVNTFPKKILTLLLQVDVAVCIFMITNMILGKETTLKNFLMALTTWGSIGNSNWYITAILILYLFTFLSFKFIKNNWVSLIFISILTIAIVYLFMKMGRPKYTYNTMICYPFGIFYSLIHEKIEKYLKNNLIFLTVLCATLIISIYLRPEIFQNIKYYSIWMGCFMIFILLFSMKINLNNSFLYFLGTHIFSIYIFQRIPMIILSTLGYASHTFTFITVSFVVTLIIAIIFDKYITPKITKFINLVIKS